MFAATIWEEKLVLLSLYFKKVHVLDAVTLHLANQRNGEGIQRWGTENELFAFGKQSDWLFINIFACLFQQLW